MAFTVKDLHDMIRILEEHPEWRTELRRLLLTDQLLELPALVHALAEAQQRTEQQVQALAKRIEELVEAQRRTEQQVAELAEAQRQIEQQVAELMAAQRRTEEEVRALATQVRELAEAQRRTEQQVAELAEAQRRTEQQVAELAEAQRRTEQQVAELAEAQRRTEQQVAELMAAQRRTEEEVRALATQVRELAEAQRRTEQQVAELAEAQRRTEQQVTELTTAQQQTERQMAELAAMQQRMEQVLLRLVEWQQGEAGRREGERYERRTIARAPNLFLGGEGGAPSDPDVRRRLTRWLHPLYQQGVTPDPPADPFLADLIWWKGDEVVLVEISQRVDAQDIRRARQRADTLRQAGVNVTPVVIGEEWATPESQVTAQAELVEWFVSGGSSQGFLRFRRLSLPEDDRK